MSKKEIIAITVALITCGVFFSRDLLSIDLPTLPSIEIPGLSRKVPEASREAAWATFQEYLGYAKNHDLEGVRRLSYELSETCKDASRRAECNGLMDGVYFIGSQFTFEDFTQFRTEKDNVYLYTDYSSGVRTIIRFASTASGLKLRGMKLCLAGDSVVPECLDD